MNTIERSRIQRSVMSNHRIKRLSIMLYGENKVGFKIGGSHNKCSTPSLYAGPESLTILNYSGYLKMQQRGYILLSPMKKGNGVTVVGENRGTRTCAN